MRPCRSILCALAILTLAACSAVAPREVAAPEPAPDLVPDEPYARSAHRFELVTGNEDVVGTLQVTTAQHEDTFVDLARRFNVGFEELIRANPGVDPWLPGEGRNIVLPTRHVLPNAPREGIVINLAAMRLFYFPRRIAGESAVVYTFPIGIGRVGFDTPEGRTRVTRMAKHPSWRPGPGVRRERRAQGEILPAVVPPGPDNPLGSRALYLGWPGYLIHGTHQPAGIGLRSSAGCIRLFPEDVELLYDLVKPGVAVTIVNQPTVFGLDDGEPVLQAFGVLEGESAAAVERRAVMRVVPARIREVLRAGGRDIDWETTMRWVATPRGVPVPLRPELGGLEQVLADARRVRNALPIGATWSGVESGDAQ